MNRKTFISKIAKLGMGTGALFFLGKSDRIAAETSAPEQEDAHRKFRTNWIKNLLRVMDETMKPEQQVDFMEQCGRACAATASLKEAEKFKGDLAGWLSTLKKWVGEQNVQQDGRKIVVKYSKCFCPMVADIEEQLPPTYCHCSKGWLKAVFETVVSHETAVTLHESIKSGGGKCRFTVEI
ncbi:hypothetical protein GF337_16025 [candidate division KSB1 bacterium]|nr:hypothetical protein [candidate division KSB1 bacterium]